MLGNDRQTLFLSLSLSDSPGSFVVVTMATNGTRFTCFSGSTLSGFHGLLALSMAGTYVSERPVGRYTAILVTSQSIK